MKKFFALFFVACLIVTIVPCGAAYLFEENSLYTIEMPDDYYFVGENEFRNDNGDTFALSYEENKDELCVRDFDDDDVKAYAEKLANEGTQAFKSLDVEGKIDVVSYKKIDNVNRKTALEIVFKTSANDEKEEIVRFQKIYVFSGEQNKYLFVYTTVDENSVDALDAAFSTIVIKEKQMESKTDKLTTLGMCAVVVALIFVGVIKFVIRTPYRKKH